MRVIVLSGARESLPCSSSHLRVPPALRSGSSGQGGPAARSPQRGLYVRGAGCRERGGQEAGACASGCRGAGFMRFPGGSEPSVGGADPRTRLDREARCRNGHGHPVAPQSRQSFPPRRGERPRAELPVRHLVVRDGISLTSVARTVVDLARTCTFRDGVVVADSALRTGQTTVPEITAVISDCARWPGVRRARAVAAFSDHRAESALESIGRVSGRSGGLSFASTGCPLPSCRSGWAVTSGSWGGRTISGPGTDDRRELTVPSSTRIRGRRCASSTGMRGCATRASRWFISPGRRSPDSVAGGGADQGRLRPRRRPSAERARAPGPVARPPVR